MGAMAQAMAIARREIRAYFSSPLALIFLAAFLSVNLFIFFWVESFFARNIADLRPLFRWLPVLMIFLVATLTMRQWSEEQRGGTLEVLLTLPINRAYLVLGKFLAVVGLIVVALALTLILPITVSFLGDLDWGPVFGGYLAAVLMASAYTAIGLFFSSRTDNQIVALILTVLVCGSFYLVGTGAVTGFVGDTPANILRAIGTGSRFESIQRGVVDLRDLVYYGSITSLFFLLNVVSLDIKRWSRGRQTAGYRRNALAGMLLLAANLILLNVWLFPLSVLRADVTASREFSLSRTTRDLIENLREPVLLRGYFGERTHPLLEPLVPAIRDMMNEYEIASKGNITTEYLDPREDEEVESEANRAYGITATPFTITERHESAVVSSYFDILVRYGDKFTVLGLGDLIEIEPRPDGDPDVRLRSLEYDLTKTIKSMASGFQSLEAVFESLESPLSLTAYVTPSSLPEQIKDAKEHIVSAVSQYEDRSGGMLLFELHDLDDPDETLTRETLEFDLGLPPFPGSIVSPEPYYLHMVLERGEEAFLIIPSGGVTEAELLIDIQTALKQAVPGLAKSLGIWIPSLDPIQDPFTGQQVPPISTYNQLLGMLSQSYSIQELDLSEGEIQGDVDVLAVIAPQQMTDKERFAVDQFLMRGGAVVVAGGYYALSTIQPPSGGLALMRLDDGLQDMLASYGVTVVQAFVLDPQNQPLTMQVPRQVRGFTVMDLEQVSYPPFVDVRRDGMATESPIMSNLSGITVQWASPLEIDEELNSDREVATLLRSTDKAWLRTSGDVMPDLNTFPQYGFAIEGPQASRTLAVSIRGAFESYFKDLPSPFEGEQVSATSTVGRMITESSESARLVVIGSSEIVDDQALNASRNLATERAALNLQFFQNALNWVAEDEELLGLRSQGSYTRLLKPFSGTDVDLQFVELDERTLWEIANMSVALVLVVAIGAVSYIRRRAESPMALVEDGDGS